MGSAFLVWSVFNPANLPEERGVVVEAAKSDFVASGVLGADADDRFQVLDDLPHDADALFAENLNQNERETLSCMWNWERLQR